VNRRGRQALGAASLALAVACAGPLPDMAPGPTPEVDRDEAGFRMVYDKFDEELATSAIVIRDPNAERHLRELVCQLSAEYCGATRVFLVRVPEFNASMAPNGTILVFSGLLLRVHNDAQLAAVLGHEISHYQRRHGIARYRNGKAWANALMILMYPAGGFGGAAAVGAFSAAQLIAVGAVQKYSRTNESEADKLGLERMVRAGYDPREAATVWRLIVKEDKVDPHRRIRVPFLESHPAEAQRIAALEQDAAKHLTPQLEGSIGKPEFDAMVEPLLATLLADELTMRRPERTEVVLAHLRAEGRLSDAEFAFQRGEMTRLRGGTGDAERALALYREAIAGDAVPPVGLRNFGFLLRNAGDAEGARTAFARYLDLLPDAPDRAVIEGHIQELTP
jgi:beta-barrel assembly-enhancing protease